MQMINFDNGIIYSDNHINIYCNEWVINDGSTVMDYKIYNKCKKKKFEFVYTTLHYYEIILKYHNEKYKDLKFLIWFETLYINGFFSMLLFLLFIKKLKKDKRYMQIKRNLFEEKFIKLKYNNKYYTIDLEFYNHINSFGYDYKTMRSVLCIFKESKTKYAFPILFVDKINNNYLHNNNISLEEYISYLRTRKRFRVGDIKKFKYYRENNFYEHESMLRNLSRVLKYYDLDY